MPTSTNNSETYPGRAYSPSQLLRAAQRKLQSFAFDGSTASQFEVDALERDALEVLRLVRSIKNTFAPINRIPLEVLSLIPGCSGEDSADRTLIALTQVCRGWRNAFTSCSSLWTRLDIRNILKTRTYIQRSQSSPLELHFGDEHVVESAFIMVVPHIPRLKSLTIHTRAPHSRVLRRFRCHTPLLERLDIGICATKRLVLDDALFNGDLSSLHDLRLGGVITLLPWKNLANLRVASLEYCFPEHAATRLLDFLESAPLLHTVKLEGPIPGSSEVPHGRIVPLRHLKSLTIKATLPHCIPLSHLLIPTGASLILEFRFNDEESSLLDYLPERSPNFSNLSNITTINLYLGSWPGPKLVRLSGPSGDLRVLVTWGDQEEASWHDHQILRSLGRLMLASAQRLTISHYFYSTSAQDGECPIFRTLSSMDNLQTLTLIICDLLPFIFALDPKRNTSNLLLCPNMEELIFYVGPPGQLHVKHLVTMAENRASRGAKLSSISIVSLGSGLVPKQGIFKLREHVTHTKLKYGAYHAHPAWDHNPGEGVAGSGGFGHGSSPVRARARSEDFDWTTVRVT